MQWSVKPEQDTSVYVLIKIIMHHLLILCALDIGDVEFGYNNYIQMVMTSCFTQQLIQILGLESQGQEVYQWRP